MNSVTALVRAYRHMTQSETKRRAPRPAAEDVLQPAATTTTTTTTLQAAPRQALKPPLGPSARRRIREALAKPSALPNQQATHATKLQQNAARQLANRHEYAAAEALLRPLVLLHPQGVDLQLDLVKCLLGQTELSGKTQDAQDTLPLLRKLIGLRPRTANQRMRLGVALYIATSHLHLQGEEAPFFRAVAYLREAVEAQPKSAHLKEMLGVCMAHQGQFDSADLLFEQAAQLHEQCTPGTQPLSFSKARALALSFKRHHLEAARFYTEALAKTPDDARLAGELGINLLQLGPTHAREALAQLSHAVRVCPESTRFSAALAQAHQAQPAGWGQRLIRSLGLELGFAGRALRSRSG